MNNKIIIIIIICMLVVTSNNGKLIIQLEWPYIMAGVMASIIADD